MATDDVTTLSSPCPCGGGKIRVTQTSPDHPWVKASQIHYSGTLDCPECSKEFVIEDGWSGAKPVMVRRADREAKTRAESAVRAAEREFESSPEAKSLIPKIVAEIDSQPSKAARHRLLQKFGLTHSTYATFIKGPTDGNSAVKSISGSTLARIGTMLELPPEEGKKIGEAHAKIESLQSAAWQLAVTPVETGATWMAK